MGKMTTFLKLLDDFHFNATTTFGLEIIRRLSLLLICVANHTYFTFDSVIGKLSCKSPIARFGGENVLTWVK